MIYIIKYIDYLYNLYDKDKYALTFDKENLQMKIFKQIDCKK